MIVLLSCHNDAHLPFVLKYLTQAEYVIIDVLKVVEGVPLEYIPTRKGIDVIYGNQIIQNVTSVWLRRPTPIDFVKPGEERFIPYIHSSLKAHMKQLFTAFADALWVSDKYAIDRASNKTYQLYIAAKQGFHIPQTIFTSDSQRAEEFVGRRPSTIVKTQATEFPQNDRGNPQAYFSTKISSRIPIDYSGLSLAPSIFQQAIDPAFDIRVTVVGDEVFAARVELRGAKRHKATRDWRLGYFEGDLQFMPFQLPKKIAHRCVALTKELGLSFGAIDLIQDKNGKIWFLEINPNGQWAFIEEATGQPIGRAVARLLRTCRNPATPAER